MKGTVKLLISIIILILFVQCETSTVFSEQKIDIKLQPHDVQQQPTTPITIIEAPIRSNIGSAGTPGSGQPGSGSGNAGQPGSGSGNAGQPGSGSGDAGQPGSGSGNAGQPGNGSGDAGQPGSGSGNAGQPGSGSGNAGQPGSGSGNAGQPGSGNGDAAQPGSGSGDAGQPGSGSGDAGQPGSGSGDAGQPGSGNGDAGQPGSGNGDAGQAGSDVGEAGQSEADGSGTPSWRDRLFDFGKDVFNNTKDFLFDSDNLVKMGRGLVVGVIGAVIAGALVAGAVALGVIAVPSLIVAGIAAGVALTIGLTYSFMSGDNFSYVNGVLASTVGAFSVLTLGAMGAGALVRGAASVGQRVLHGAVASMKSTVASKWFGLHLTGNLGLSYFSWWSGTDGGAIPGTRELLGIVGTAVVSTFVFDKVGGALKSAVTLRGASGFSMRRVIDGSTAVVAQIVNNRIMGNRDKDTPILSFVSAAVLGKVGDRFLKSTKQKIGTTMNDVKQFLGRPFQRTDANSKTRTITNKNLDQLSQDPSKINPNTLSHFRENPSISEKQANLLNRNQATFDKYSVGTQITQSTVAEGINQGLDHVPHGDKLKTEIDTVEKSKQLYNKVDEKISDPLEKGVEKGVGWIESKTK